MDKSKELQLICFLSSWCRIRPKKISSGMRSEEELRGDPGKRRRDICSFTLVPPGR
jgi:hypothetical protein